jgi:hypothetical protein
MTKASTVRPSVVPVRSFPTSSTDPKVANNSPASLTLATKLGTAAYTISIDHLYCKRLTKVVASRITPRRFVDFAKLTASLTESDLRSISSSSPAGTSDASVLFLDRPQYEAKNTASGRQPCTPRVSKALTIGLFPVESSTDRGVETAKDDFSPWTRFPSFVNYMKNTIDKGIDFT